MPGTLGGKMPRFPDGRVEREESGFIPALIPPVFERSYFLPFSQRVCHPVSCTHILMAFKINCPTIFQMVYYNELIYLY